MKLYIKSTVRVSLQVLQTFTCYILSLCFPLLRGPHVVTAPLYSDEKLHGSFTFSGSWQNFTVM